MNSKGENIDIVGFHPNFQGGISTPCIIIVVCRYKQLRLGFTTRSLRLRSGRSEILDKIVLFGQIILQIKMSQLDPKL